MYLMTSSLPKCLACFLLYFTQNLKESRLHTMTVECVFPNT